MWPGALYGERLRPGSERLRGDRDANHGLLEVRRNFLDIGANGGGMLSYLGGYKDTAKDRNRRPEW